ncbi:hypothetical protein [Marinitenerispora sediminis]|uniref:Uncharacterized protein n=1 Tax=Marinitenerispora sediminis TaxID=1931232 RepID=A0A368TAL2_9ACTN|nr:hypothetical protein [Marinitenerispora sediminis]RCV50804.1 hypothetical protein DEF28_17235 [Marinitenerispora sediminis]RCV55020.1 hypothetical protein DEF23_14880 [Marinitenerispora sediminis]RCV62058.1 hypothetical protein DEF24_02495 [Marinitenerispora sediminis]
METREKAAAARQAMERGAALGGLLPAPLEFVVADTAQADPAAAGGTAFTASATYVCRLGAAATPVLEALHTAWRERGWDGSLRRFPDGGGDAEASDPADGYRYTALIRRDGTSLALWVESPPYRDPDPETRFRPIRPA